MMRKSIGVIALCLSAFFVSNPLFAQVAVELRTNVDNANPTWTINQRQYPTQFSDIKVRVDGSLISVDESAVIIREHNLVALPTSVSSPDVDGWQRVTWTSRFTGSRGENVGGNRASIIVTHNGASGSATAFQADTTMPFIRIVGNAGMPVHDADFGEVAVGSTDTLLFALQARVARMSSQGYELPVPVDSITFSSDVFSYAWRDNSWAPAGPIPNAITSPLRYGFDVICAPKNADAVQAFMTVHYNSGSTFVMPLSVNIQPVEAIPNIRVLSPNGGEQFAPCEDVTVTWTGAVPNLMVEVEYSTDGGNSWTLIDRTLDSSAVWTVPNVASDQVSLRVRQDQAQTFERDLRSEQKSAITKLAYHSDNVRLLAAYEDGHISEWNTQTEQERTFSLTPGLQVFDMQYDEIEDQVYVAWNRGDGTPVKVGLYSISSGDELGAITLPSEIDVAAVQIDVASGNVLIQEQLGPNVYLYDLQSGERDVLPFQMPVATFSLDKLTNVLTVALYNGNIVQFDFQSLQETKRFSVPNLPLIHQLDIGPLNELIAFSCVPSSVTLATSNRTELHLYNVSTQTMVASNFEAGSRSVSFSLSNTRRWAGVGFGGFPQVALWNIAANNKLESLGGNSGTLTDMVISPNGYNIASASNASDYNLKVKRFSAPESDVSDSFFAISQAVVDVDTIDFGTVYFGEVRDTISTEDLCNTGLTTAIFERGYMFNGSYFSETSTPSYPDTLFPQLCTERMFNFVAGDTGIIQDAYILESCTDNFQLPLKARVLYRDIEFNSGRSIDFGRVCVGTYVEKEFTILTNRDPIPLVINSIAPIDVLNSAFEVFPPVVDTVVGPGESLTVKVRFAPSRAGEFAEAILLVHTNQTRYIEHLEFTGTAFGADIKLSHSVLRFIPEEPERTLTVSNNGVDYTVLLDAYTTLGNYAVDFQPNEVIEAGNSYELNVSSSFAEQVLQDTLVLEFEECGLTLKVPIEQYIGETTFSVSEVEVLETDTAFIPITFSTKNNSGAYGGVRFADLYLECEARLFYPLGVVAETGAQLEEIEHWVENGQRIMNLNVRANFDSNDSLLLIGLPGLDEDNFTVLAPTDTPRATMGTGVDVVVQPGTLTIVKKVEDRIVQIVQAPTLVGVSPNPVDRGSTVQVDVTSTLDTDVTLCLVDQRGESLSLGTYTLVNGTQQLAFAVPDVASGQYSLVLCGASGSVLSSLPIILQ